MRARLFARYGPEAGLETEFGAEATIGRAKDSTVPLSAREVSQRHARITFDAASAAYWVEDLGSLNGTLLDGEPLSGRQRLGALHVLSFGGTADLFFVELDLAPAAAPEAPAPEGAGEETAEKGDGRATRVDAEAPTLPVELREVAEDDRTRADAEVPTLPAGLRAPAADGRAAAKPGAATRVDERPAELPPSLSGGAEPTAPPARRFVLEVLGSAGGSFELGPGDNLVGRSNRARVALRHRELSRRHATLRVAGDRVWLRDEGSRNHTFVAGEQIDGEVELAPGSELRFGRLAARLTLAADEPGDPEAG